MTAHFPGINEIRAVIEDENKLSLENAEKNWL